MKNNRLLHILIICLLIFSFLPVSAVFAAEEEEVEVPGHKDSVNAIAFNRNGRYLISGSSDKSIRFWDVENGEEVQVVEDAHAGVIRTLDVNSRGDLIATGGDDYIINLWRLELRQEDSSGGVGDIFTVKVDSPIIIQKLDPLGGHFGPVNDLVFTQNGRFLASASSDKHIKLWDVKNRTLLRTLSGHTDEVYCVAFNASGSLLASGGKDKTIKIWDVSTGNLIRTITGHITAIQKLAFVPNRDVLASSGWRELFYWDLASGSMLKSFNGQDISSLAFDPNGTILATGGSGLFKTIKLYNAFSGSLLHEIVGHEGAISEVVFSPDGRFLASASDDWNVMFWDIRTGKSKFEEQ